MWSISVGNIDMHAQVVILSLFLEEARISQEGKTCVEKAEYESTKVIAV